MDGSFCHPSSTTFIPSDPFLRFRSMVSACTVFILDGASIVLMRTSFKVKSELIKISYVNKKYNPLKEYNDIIQVHLEVC